jgi:hypothetical protein
MYKKRQANPAVLLENSSFNRKVPVEVVIGIRGDLANLNLILPLNSQQ